jgi:hypothetical protein
LGIAAEAFPRPFREVFDLFIFDSEFTAQENDLAVLFAQAFFDLLDVSCRDRSRRVVGCGCPLSRFGTEMLARLDDVAASTGSACHSGRIELSPVLQAIGIAPEIGMGAVRFSLGRMTTRDEIDVVVERLTEVFVEAG